MSSKSDISMKCCSVLCRPSQSLLVAGLVYAEPATPALCLEVCGSCPASTGFGSPGTPGFPTPVLGLWCPCHLAYQHHPCQYPFLQVSLFCMHLPSYFFFWVCFCWWTSESTFAKYENDPTFGDQAIKIMVADQLDSTLNIVNCLDFFRHFSSPIWNRDNIGLSWVTCFLAEWGECPELVFNTIHLGSHLMV